MKLTTKYQKAKRFRETEIANALILTRIQLSLPDERCIDLAGKVPINAYASRDTIYIDVFRNNEHEIVGYVEEL